MAIEDAPFDNHAYVREQGVWKRLANYFDGNRRFYPTMSSVVEGVASVDGTLGALSAFGELSGSASGISTVVGALTNGAAPGLSRIIGVDWTNGTTSTEGGAITPTVATRASPARQVDYDAVNGLNRITSVGPNIMRVGSWWDGTSIINGAEIEPAATQIIPRSDLSEGWGLFNLVSFDADPTEIGPVVGQNPRLFVPTAVSAFHYIETPVVPGALTIGQEYIYSMFVKSNGYNFFYQDSEQAGTFPVNVFNLTTGAIDVTSNTSFLRGGGSEFWGNGWWRVWSIYEAAQTEWAGYGNFQPGVNDGGNFVGSGNGEGWICGAMVELNTGRNRPSSLIDSAASGGIVREPDVLQYTIPSSGGPLTLVGEIAAKSEQAGNLITVSQGISNDSVISLGVDASGNGNAIMRSGGADVATLVGTALNLSEWYSQRVLLDTNDFRLFIDEVLQDSDTVGAAPTGLTRVSIGCDESGANQPGGLVGPFELISGLET